MPRKGVQVNMWVHPDVAKCLKEIAELTDKPQREVLEQMVYDSYDLFQKRKDGAVVLLFTKGKGVEYEKISLGLRIPLGGGYGTGPD